MEPGRAVLSGRNSAPAGHSGGVEPNGSTAATPKSDAASLNADRSLAADKLEGVEEIARFLGEGWTAQRVYNARRSSALPIRKKPGVGIYAFRSEIEAALRAPETLADLTSAST